MKGVVLGARPDEPAKVLELLAGTVALCGDMTAEVDMTPFRSATNVREVLTEIYRTVNLPHTTEEVVPHVKAVLDALSPLEIGSPPDSLNLLRSPHVSRVTAKIAAVALNLETIVEQAIDKQHFPEEDKIRVATKVAEIVSAAEHLEDFARAGDTNGPDLVVPNLMALVENVSALKKVTDTEDDILLLCTVAKHAPHITSAANKLLPQVESQVTSIADRLTNILLPPKASDQVKQEIAAHAVDILERWKQQLNSQPKWTPTARPRPELDPQLDPWKPEPMPRMNDKAEQILKDLAAIQPPSQDSDEMLKVWRHEWRCLIPAVVHQKFALCTNVRFPLLFYAKVIEAIARDPRVQPQVKEGLTQIAEHIHQGRRFKVGRESKVLTVDAYEAMSEKTIDPLSEDALRQLFMPKRPSRCTDPLCVIL